MLQYRFEFCLNDDMSSERFFMALNPTDALRLLCLNALRNSPFKNHSQEDQELFAVAFANPKTEWHTPPELLPVPDPIPDLELPEPPQEIEVVEEEVEEVETLQEGEGDSSEGVSDPTQAEGQDLDSSPENILQGTQGEEENAFVFEQPKSDPVEEHKIKQREREEEISKIKERNSLITQKYESQKHRVQEFLNWFESAFSIVTFEEYNRWIDKWVAVDYPLVEQAEENEDD